MFDWFSRHGGLQLPCPAEGERLLVPGEDGDREPAVPSGDDEEDAERAEELGPGPVPVAGLSQAKGLGNYLYNAASSATKKVSESVRDTAQTIKKSVEERKIDNLFNKTIIGDFKKEQEKFVKEKKSKKSGSTLPPWAGYIEEETIRQQILSLSADRRNFLRDPPAGVQFNFEFDRIAPVAMVMLREDELLNKVRFDLVPKLVKEEQFWKNYFYRVSLIKQSADLSLLAAQHTGRSKRKGDPLEDQAPATDSILSKTAPVNRQSESVEDNLPEGTEQFGMSAGKPTSVQDDDIPEWEKELQRELQEFEIVEGSEKINQAWEKEIEEMLQAADSKG